MRFFFHFPTLRRLLLRGWSRWRLSWRLWLSAISLLLVLRSFLQEFGGYASCSAKDPDKKVILLSVCLCWLLLSSLMGLRRRGLRLALALVLLLLGSGHGVKGFGG